MLTYETALIECQIDAVQEYVNRYNNKKTEERKELAPAEKIEYVDDLIAMLTSGR